MTFSLVKTQILPSSVASLVHEKIFELETMKIALEKQTNLSNPKRPRIYMVISKKIWRGIGAKQGCMSFYVNTRTFFDLCHLLKMHVCPLVQTGVHLKEEWIEKPLRQQANDLLSAGWDTSVCLFPRLSWWTKRNPEHVAWSFTSGN